MVGVLIVVEVVVVEVVVVEVVVVEVVEPVEEVVLVEVLAEVVVEPVEVVLQDVVVGSSGRPVVGGALLRWPPLPRGPLKAAWLADSSSGAAWKVELVDCQRIPAAAKPAILRRISRLVTSICFPRVPASPLSIDPPRASLRSFRRLGSR